MKLSSANLLLFAACGLSLAGYTLAGERSIRDSAPAACSNISSVAPPFNVTTLPSPFVFLNGTNVTTAEDFVCRQAELDALLQAFELGEKPGVPSVFEYSFSDNEVTLIAGNGTTNITWTVSLTPPTAADAPTPYAVIIGMDGISIPQPPNVGVLTIDIDDIAQQNDASSRGIGLFYDLYGANATASSMMAWSWSVSRLIDALEGLGNQTDIDTTKLAVTGCSRDGKGALVAGAFDERIVLTIPQESGSGGSACWRLSDAMFAEGDDVQTAHEIVDENVWFALSFDAFVNATNTLPFDHHSLAALVAPRAMYVIENTAYEWLGPWSCFGCMETAHRAWEALGVPDNMGFSQIGNHSHCVFPVTEQGFELTAFVEKFLFGNMSTNTTVMRTDLNTTFDLSEWAPWAVPDLSA